jgi:putative transposase
LRLALTLGQQANCTVAAELLAGLSVGVVLADKSHNTDALIADIIRAGARVVVPSKRRRRTQRALDHNLYADRNKVESFFNCFKQYRLFSGLCPLRGYFRLAILIVNTP